AGDGVVHGAGGGHSPPGRALPGAGEAGRPGPFEQLPAAGVPGDRGDPRAGPLSDPDDPAGRAGEGPELGVAGRGCRGRSHREYRDRREDDRCAPKNRHATAPLCRQRAVTPRASALPLSRRHLAARAMSSRRRVPRTTLAGGAEGTLEERWRSREDLAMVISAWPVGIDPLQTLARVARTRAGRGRARQVTSVDGPATWPPPWPRACAARGRWPRRCAKLSARLPGRSRRPEACRGCCAPAAPRRAHRG